MSNQVIVQNKLILITGDPGSGKSFFACFLAASYREIHSNFRITYNGSLVSNDLYSIDEVKNLHFSETKGVIVLDEAGVNMNSRKFATDENMEYGKLAMLGRKLNKDIIVIAQMRHTVDKNVRMLCKYNFDMTAWRTGKEYMMYEFTLVDRNERIQAIKEIDLIKWSKDSGYSYSSMESSVISKPEDKDIIIDDAGFNILKKRKKYERRNKDLY